MQKSLHLVLLLIPFCISCNRYQYSTISSPQLEKNDRNELVFENDTLVMVYNFMGPDLGPTIFIENKLMEPVYIDWRGSALVVNGHTYSYAAIELDPHGNVVDGSGSATVDYISPRGTLNKTPLVLSQRYSTSIPREQLLKTTYTAAGYSYPVKTAIFTEATSPLRFRSDITYLVGSLKSEPRYFEHRFYVSGMMNAKAGPQAIMQNGDHGNQFFTSRHNGGGAATAALLTGAIVEGVIMAAGGLIGGQ
ncbi:hypothetical protein A4H97_26480 [Niastella yeongjuensis]|uniref:Uncharacterized protein n=1 Tax=Niastella yeongjuensis TaxID=354355 RepID=A0A1V9F069_9BACT|nr:hypothetical protein [Niastella yeongjuensis]OQP51760.1 hypothetical protein A4H97_26480 [Niastella yeongjuensis]SEP48748.1 hypothetical protein SAMN05660816_06817 [Niastella yeongjuensis]